VGRQHRADAAVTVRVRADDDPVRLDALEHRHARGKGHAVDGDAQIPGWTSASHETAALMVLTASITVALGLPGPRLSTTVLARPIIDGAFGGEH
jgi:hypothetical protein